MRQVVTFCKPVIIFRDKGAPLAQLDRASGYEADANSIQVVATVALTRNWPSLACSKVAPKLAHPFPATVRQWRSDPEDQLLT